MSIKYKNNGAWLKSPNTINIIQKTDIPEEAFNITGDCMYRFSNGWEWFIRDYGSKITTKDIRTATNMFKNLQVEKIPFDINCVSKDYVDTAYLFSGCSIKSVPKVVCKPSSTTYMFQGCGYLRNIPEDFNNGFDWSYIDSQTSAYSGSRSNMFYSCYSLRSIPMNFLEHGNPIINTSYAYFNGGFNECVSLDELVELPLPFTADYTSNLFNYSFIKCSRLKNLTFALDPDTNAPYVMRWKAQTIDLSQYVGYVDTYGAGFVINYNSGITNDTLVYDDASYQALKDNPDYWTKVLKYSRYNHDSAVETINSLPDTSAYLATDGGTNTIKFKGDSGSATDGGAINTLTAEEIAVATAKGWTVTFA